MEVVSNNYLPGDQRLVDKIIYELKAQGIFDQFRKECFADVDTKPAYQNLRQRVEGSVSGFLKEQSWRPDMNKNQVREMLRKRITESGYLEIGVERIVDQVVNPKINSVFLPKVEEVFYKYLGIKKPNAKSEVKPSSAVDLLPSDLEAVSPEPECTDVKKEEKSCVNNENSVDTEDNKTEEDESPPFEPLEIEQSTSFAAQEDNSVDSHMSGFSGLASHESSQSNEHNKPIQMEQDSQMSRNSSDSRLSIITSDENSKMDITDSKSSDSTQVKYDKYKSHEKDKDKHRSHSDTHKSERAGGRDRDRRSSKDSKSRYSSSSSKDKSRDRKDSRSSSSAKDKEKSKSDNKYNKDRDKPRHSSSSNKDKSVKHDSKSSDKDKSRSHKDSRAKESNSKHKDNKSSSSLSHKHSSSSHSSDRHKKDKDKKKSKDDHYSSKDKRGDRRSTDRDSNDGQSSKGSQGSSSETQASNSQKNNQESSSSSISKTGTGDSGNSDQVKTAINISDNMEKSDNYENEAINSNVKLLKPKYASNIKEALKLMKIRKQLAKLEKENQLCLVDVDVNSTILESSINIDEITSKNNLNITQETLNLKIVNELETVPSPLQNTVISQDNWDAMEAKLRQEVEEFQDIDDSASNKDLDENQPKSLNNEVQRSDKYLFEDNGIEECKYFDKVDFKSLKFVQFVKKYIEQLEINTAGRKRKVEDTDLKNNNRIHTKEKKRKIMKKINTEVSTNDSLNFSLPLSPADSEKSEKKEEVKIVKRNSSKINNQRYSSEDLYKPRPTFATSRRRGAKTLES